MTSECKMSASGQHRWCTNIPRSGEPQGPERCGECGEERPATTNAEIRDAALAYLTDDFKSTHPLVEFDCHANNLDNTVLAGWNATNGVRLEKTITIAEWEGTEPPIRTALLALKWEGCV